ncbi:MAG: hypothetical protein HY459_04735, partial [Parcubacteria group bacterium]|nr:hypothetical protein [Parcubacteria group bacterium]
TYTVREILQPGWVQTTDNPPPIIVGSGTHAGHVDFGNFQLGEIHGMKFNDLDGDGEKDPEEPGLPGWVITLTGRNHAPESTPTGPDGSYSFFDVFFDIYTLTEEPQAGWIQTTSNPFPFEVRSNERVMGKDFGNFKLGAIHGMKFHDFDADGVKDAGEPGLNGWTIELRDLQGNILETQVTHTEGEESGWYWFMDLRPGTYVVREVLQVPWIQSLPGVAQNYQYVVTIDESGQVFEPKDFGNFKLGEIHGRKFEDLDGDGRRDRGEPGLPGWTIQLWQNNQVVDTTETNQAGEYWFMELTPGAYTVVEILQGDWIQTAPRNRVHEVLLRSGRIVSGKDFGNAREAEVHGRKFEDRNRNGRRDEDEPYLAGWEIRLIPLSGQGGRRVTTLTNAQGEYWFMDLLPGRYLLLEDREPGWIAVEPRSGLYVLRLQSGQILTDRNFANARIGNLF